MLTLAIKLMRNCLNYLFFLTLLILGCSNQVEIVKAQPIEVYSTNFDSLNPGLALTGQDGWVTNDPKGPGGPAGESDGLTRLVFPDGESSRAAYIGGPYRAAYPPGKTNVMLWPEINGLGATLKFTVTILIMPSDANGLHSESDTFAWTFLDDTNAPMFSIAFEPTEDDPELRKVTVLNENGVKINLEVQHLINIRQLYELEVLMVPNGNHVSASAKLSNAVSEINFAFLELPACSTHRVTGVAANWIMTDAKIHENGIATGFGSNYMAFDNYALSTDDSVYVSIGDKIISESNNFAVITATICDPIDEDTIIKYETVDGSALAGLDYESSEAVLVIPAGQVSANLEIPIMKDLLNEENKFFFVRFSTESQKIKFMNSEIKVTIENSFKSLEAPRITQVKHLKGTGKIEITWDSEPRSFYMISYSDNLRAWTNATADAVFSQGNQTTITIEMTNKRDQFFRLENLGSLAAQRP